VAPVNTSVGSAPLSANAAGLVITLRPSNSITRLGENRPRDHPYAGTLAFERGEMNGLFEFGRRCAVAGRVGVNSDQALAPSAQMMPPPRKAPTALCSAKIRECKAVEKFPSPPPLN